MAATVLQWHRTYRQTFVGGPTSRRTRRECWAATSSDGVWHAERIEDVGTPWVLMHLPTRTDLGLFSTLERVKAYVMTGRADQALTERDTDGEG
jgi:hypothetical protein